MIRLFALLALLVSGVALAPSASAQPIPGAGCPKNASPCTVSGAGTTTAITEANRAAAVIDARNYGVTCNGTTNDAAAFNLATAAFRTALDAGYGAKLLLPNSGSLSSTGKCKILSTLNFTNLRSRGGVIDGRGTTIDCQVTGSTASDGCIDATGSDFIDWHGPYIIGSSSTIPAFGLQIVRQTNATDCAEQHFYGTKITGKFSRQAFLNVACENVGGIGVHFENSNAASGCYAAAWDGENHWDARSAFAPVTLPVDTASSLGDNSLTASSVLVSSCTGAAGVAWFANVGKFEFSQGYTLNRNSTSDSVMLFDNSHGPNKLINWDAHNETNYPSLFLLSGSNASPVVHGLRLRDQGPQAQVSIFALDSGVTSATIRDFEYTTTDTLNPVPRAFDSPGVYTASVDIHVPAPAAWGPPGTVSGRVCIADTCNATGVVGPADAAGGSAAVAFSCSHKAILTYTGPLCNVRRDSDSATLDFYADANGNFPVAQALAWGGTAGLWVAKAYDQTGGGCDAVQATAANQPQMLLSSTFGTGRPIMAWTDASAQSLSIPACSALNTWMLTGGTITAVVQMTVSSPSAQDYLFDQNAVTQAFLAGRTLVFTQSAATTIGSWQTTASIALAGHVLDIEYSKSSVSNVPTVNFDGSSQAFSAAQQPVGAITAYVGATLIGNRLVGGTNRGFPGNIGDFILWNSTVSSAFLVSFRKTEGTFWGVTE